GRKRPPPAEILASPRRRRAAEAELRDGGALFPSPLVGEGGSLARSDSETDEGSVSAERTPHPALRATFSHKGRRGKRSRRLGQIRVEMLQPRHHFLLQQAQRIVPRLGLVLVVETEHQERAEAADLVIDFF